MTVIGVIGNRQLFDTLGASVCGAFDGFDAKARGRAAHLDGPPHAFDGMLRQQLQDANELAGAGMGPLTLLQLLPQFGENRR